MIPTTDQKAKRLAQISSDLTKHGEIDICKFWQIKKFDVENSHEVRTDKWVNPPSLTALLVAAVTSEVRMV
jgi:hypothetical protein